ncbi:hypothetical protein K1719_000971 [Acacia pycnantha]|nr:hypothetical protein K1719_000971 [Acacia pycnantha]
MVLPVVDTEYPKEIDKARHDLRALITSRNYAPLMLLLVWHESGTYNAEMKTGEPDGSIRNGEDWKNHICRPLLAEVTGGPTTDFVPGRRVSCGSPSKSYLLWSHCLLLIHHNNTKEKRLPVPVQGEEHIQRDKGLMLYTKDEDAFLRDYAESNKKLSEFGYSRHCAPQVKDPTVLSYCTCPCGLWDLSYPFLPQLCDLPAQTM